jgi:hypothetical protein
VKKLRLWIVDVAPELDPDLMFHFKKSGAVSVAISKNLAKSWLAKSDQKIRL